MQAIKEIRANCGILRRLTIISKLFLVAGEKMMDL